MNYTDKVRDELATALEGCEPDDIVIVFYDELTKLLANDPDYFANGRGNSLRHTLSMAESLVREATQREA